MSSKTQPVVTGSLGLGLFWQSFGDLKVAKVEAKFRRFWYRLIIWICLLVAITILVLPLSWDIVRRQHHVEGDVRRHALDYENNLRANGRCCDFLLARLTEKQSKASAPLFKSSNRAKELGLSLDDLDASEILTLCAAGLVFEKDDSLYAEEVQKGQLGIITGPRDGRIFVDNDQDGWFELHVPHSSGESFQLLVDGGNYKVAWKMRDKWSFNP